MSKRLIVCSDGTWNRPDSHNPTNVVKMARAIVPTAADGKAQVVFYDKGVGTGNILDRITGGAFGGGLEQNIGDAYRFLMHNYDDGDEIFLFGFSRGAYTVRSTAGLIRNSGLLRKARADLFTEAYRLYRDNAVHPDSDEAKRFRNNNSREVGIHFLGVWDTVGALGIPVRGLRWLTRGKHQFHDVELSGSVKNAYQALAIDEKRGPFVPSIWASKQKPGQTVEQVWFAGVHTDVGGGYRDTGLSDIAFQWMHSKAESCGLTFDKDYLVAVLHPDVSIPMRNSKAGLYKFTRGFVRRLTPGEGSTEAVHPAVIARRETHGLSYNPRNLADYLDHPEHKIAEI